MRICFLPVPITSSDLDVVWPRYRFARSSRLWLRWPGVQQIAGHHRVKGHARQVDARGRSTTMSYLRFWPIFFDPWVLEDPSQGLAEPVAGGSSRGRRPAPRTGTS